MNATTADNATTRAGTSLQRISKRRIPRIGAFIVFLLFAFVVVVPSVGSLPELSFYDSKRVLQVGLLLLSGGWVLFTLTRQNGPIVTYSLLPTGGRRVVGVVLVLGCISALLAPLPLYGFLEVFHLFLLGALALCVAHFHRLRSFVNDTVLVAVVSVSALLYVTSFGVGYVMSLLFPEIKLWPAGYTGFDHVRFFNQFQTWTFSLLVLAPLMFSDKRGWRRNLLLIPLAAWWMLLFASGGRGTLLGLLAAAAAVLISFGRQAAPWLRLQTLTAAAGAMAYGLLFKVAAMTNASLLDRNVTTDMGRFYYWQHSVDVIRENWILGLGPMHHAGFTNEFWSHPHNTVLQWGVEWGVPATAVLTLLILWGFWSWIRQSRRYLKTEHESYEGQVRIALTGSLTAAGVHALFSGITIMPMSQTVGALVLGWTLGHFILGRTAERPLIERRPSPTRRLVLAGVFGLALGIVAWGTIPDALRRDESVDNYIEAVKPNHLHPRYWRQGAIRY